MLRKQKIIPAQLSQVQLLEHEESGKSQMQTDMHYYGTYAMARAAGLKQEICYKIAYSAQFVDDNAGHLSLFTLDGAHLYVTATAHHSVDRNNLNEADQHLVWVPFHFLPGAIGESYEERLLCRKNSKVAQEMFNHYIDMPDKEFSPYLIGIAAHVYADTFSHYGFSGISSELNEIAGDSIEFRDNLSGEVTDYIKQKFNRFEHKSNRFKIRFFRLLSKLTRLRTWFAAEFAEALARGLGHGAAHTYPDRPFLEWQFNYEHSGESSGWRKNSETFLEACEQLYERFRMIANSIPDCKESEGKEFADIKDKVASVLQTQAKMEGRIEAWQEAARSGELFGFNEEIPTYNAQQWLSQIESVEENAHSNDVLSSDVFKFLQAAAVHRTYVLRDLLPSHGLLVR